jgi:hypothetical protein
VLSLQSQYRFVWQNFIFTLNLAIVLEFLCSVAVLAESNFPFAGINCSGNLSVSAFLDVSQTSMELLFEQVENPEPCVKKSGNILSTELLYIW